MDNTSFTQELLKEVLIQAPVLLASSLGWLISIRFWRAAPAASRWCAAACLLALAGSGLMIYGWMAEKLFVAERVVPVLRAVTYILFLIGVYAGRKMTATAGADPQATFWQPLHEMLRVRPWLKGLFRTSFVSTFLLVMVGSVIIAFIKPECFVGVARVRLRINTPISAATNSTNSAAEKFSSRQLQTECEVIQSQVVLAKVVENSKLNLKERWSIKFHGGEPLSTSETTDLLKHFIAVAPVRNASIIEIHLYSDNPGDAAELANALAESYCGYLVAESKASDPANVDKPEAFVAEIIDRAKPNPIPVRPNKSLDISLGFWGALWLAVVVGALVVWVSIKFENKRTAVPGSKDGEEAGREWVRAQNNLGAALRDQARRSDGVEALRLLDEAAAAYRVVLDAGTREGFPQGWAMAQNNLGVLLRDRAEWSQPDVAVRILKEAVNAHRAALEVYTRAEYARYWATTETNLSVALRDLAGRSEGTEAIRLLNEAVAASRAALEA